jgi:hypothetical protein
MSKEVEYCPHCQAKMVEYRHTFNKGLANGLFQLYAAGGGPISLRDLKISRTEWTNFQKLRYWELASRTRTEGEWVLTNLGRDFIFTKTAIQKWVWTYRGSTVRFDGDTVYFNDIHDPVFETKQDYVANSQARGYR